MVNKVLIRNTHNNSTEKPVMFILTNYRNPKESDSNGSNNSD